MVKVSTEEELGKAIKNKEDYIEVEFDLQKHVVKIKATGQIAWAIVIAVLTVVVVGLISAPATGGTSALVGLGVTAPAAVSILGLGGTQAAVAIAVAGGGVGILNQLREYKMERFSDGRMILKR